MNEQTLELISDPDILITLNQLAANVARHEQLEFCDGKGFYEKLASACESDPENLGGLVRELRERFPNQSLELRTSLASQLVTAWCKHNEAKLLTELPLDRVHDWLTPGKASAAYTQTLQSTLSPGDAEQVMDDARRIARRLKSPEAAGSTGSLLWRGLVVGRVQSGKTASIGGVISNLADSGYTMFIVLSGSKENLRMQNQRRLQNDLTSAASTPRFISNASQSGFAFPPAEARQQLQGTRVLGVSQGPYVISVVIKYVSQLRRMAEILERIANPSLRVVVIDDEADQASLNANAGDPERDPTRVNDAVRTLVYKAAPGRVAYLAYTATPFGNLLNEFDEQGKPMTLEPADGIYPLSKSPKYFGLAEIFGMGEYAGMGVTRDIDATCIKQLAELPKQKRIPEALEAALRWFLLATAVLRLRRGERHTTMLVHTSQLVATHETLRSAIEERIETWRRNPTEFEADFRLTFDNEHRRLTPATLTAARPEYGETFPAQNESFSDVWIEVRRILSAPLNPNVPPTLFRDPEANVAGGSLEHALRIVSDNSHTNHEDRLGYPKGGAWAQIVVGGNTLSRGLTLEGLVCSFFSRNTGTYDTLMQMGRWFGYRRSYEDLPRVWLTPEAKEVFKVLSGDEEYLMAQLRQLDGQLRPADVNIFIRRTIRRMKATRFMNSISEPSDVEFDGEYTTLSVSADERDNRTNDQLVQELFRESTLSIPRAGCLSAPRTSEQVVALLEAWAGRAERHQSVASWIRARLAGKLWNAVVISGEGPAVTIAGRQVAAVNRRTGEQVGARISFKQISSAADLVVDLREEAVRPDDSELFARLTEAEKAGVSRERFLQLRASSPVVRPLLLIYPINTATDNTKLQLVWGLSVIAPIASDVPPPGEWVTQRRELLT